MNIDAVLEEAAREPRDGWDSANRLPIPPEAVFRAKELLWLLEDLMPVEITWDAMGGIWLEWNGDGWMLCVSVFHTSTVMILDVGPDRRSYIGRDADMTADLLRCLVAEAKESASSTLRSASTEEAYAERIESRAFVRDDDVLSAGDQAALKHQAALDEAANDEVDPAHWGREVERLRSLPRVAEYDGDELPFFDFDVLAEPAADE